MHPVWKVLKSGAPAAYWYNPTNGVVRARVGSVGTADETLEFYNEVNDSAETALGNYSSAGGT
jgi:hypothetical protein